MPRSPDLGTGPGHAALMALSRRQHLVLLFLVAWGLNPRNILPFRFAVPFLTKSHVCFGRRGFPCEVRDKSCRSIL